MSDCPETARTFNVQSLTGSCISGSFSGEMQSSASPLTLQTFPSVSGRGRDGHEWDGLSVRQSKDVWAQSGAGWEQEEVVLIKQCRERLLLELAEFGVPLTVHGP